jgi:hypothetical protein
MRTLQKVKVREELTPSITTFGTVAPVVDVISATRSRPPESVTSPRTMLGDISIVTPRQEQITIPAIATITRVTPATRTVLTPGITDLTPPFTPGFTPGRPVPPRVVPPIVPFGAMNIPLGIFERDQLGGARRSKSPTARYAPSVTASVFNIFTTKKQKASGWTGFETRPMVVPKSGTILEHPFGTKGKAKKSPGSRTKKELTNFIEFKPFKLDLDFGRRKR